MEKNLLEKSIIRDNDKIYISVSNFCKVLKIKDILKLNLGDEQKKRVVKMILFLFKDRIDSNKHLAKQFKDKEEANKLWLNTYKEKKDKLCLEEFTELVLIEQRKFKEEYYHVRGDHYIYSFWDMFRELGNGSRIVFLVKKDFSEILIKRIVGHKIENSITFGYDYYTIEDFESRDDSKPFTSKITIPDGKMLFINFLDSAKLEDVWKKEKSHRYYHLDNNIGLEHLTNRFSEENIFFSQTGNLSLYIYHNPIEKRFICLTQEYDDLDVDESTLSSTNLKKFEKFQQYMKNYTLIGKVSNSMWRFIVCHQDTLELHKPECYIESHGSYPSSLFFDLEIDKPIQLSMKNHFKTLVKFPTDPPIYLPDYYEDELIIIDYSY